MLKIKCDKVGRFYIGKNVKTFCPFFKTDKVFIRYSLCSTNENGTKTVTIKLSVSPDIYRDDIACNDVCLFYANVDKTGRFMLPKDIPNRHLFLDTDFFFSSDREFNYTASTSEILRDESKTPSKIKRLLNYLLFKK